MVLSNRESRNFGSNLQNIVECYIFGDMRVGDDKFDIFWTVCTDLVPEEKQGLLVVVHGDGRLGQLGLEQLPQIHKVM